MFSGRLALCAIVDVGPRQQLVDFAHGMAVGDFVEDVGEPRLRIDIVHLAGFDQRGVDGPISSALVRAGEQMILRPSAMGRMARSTTLLSISIRPSSR